MIKFLLIILTAGFSLQQILAMNNEEIERMEVKRFGLLDDGRTVKVYTLKNKIGNNIEILDLGGIIKSINVADHNGEFSDIALGFNNPQQYLTDSPYMGALIGRYANRIAKGLPVLQDIRKTFLPKDSAREKSL